MAEPQTIPSPSPKRKVQPRADMQGAAPFVPSAPTTGAEAAANWGIQNADAHQTNLKIQRPIPGTRRLELLEDIPLMQWAMKDTAAQYGPGVYVIKPGGGVFKDRQATIEVSEEFARRSGWNRIETAPPPSAVLGMQLAQKASDSMGAGHLGMVLESVLKPIMERLERIESKNQNGFDPMAMITLLQTMEDKGQQRMIAQLDLLERLRGGKGLKVEDTEEESGGMMAQLGKGLGLGLGELVMNLGKPKTQAIPTNGMIPGTAVPSARTQEAQAVLTTASHVPSGWTAEEFAQVEPLAMLLKDYVPKLRAGRLMSDEEGMADTLLDILQPEAHAPLMTLAKKTEEMGPAALMVVDASLANDYWVKVVQTLRDYIMQPEGPSMNPVGG